MVAMEYGFLRAGGAVDLAQNFLGQHLQLGIRGVHVFQSAIVRLQCMEKNSSAFGFHKLCDLLLLL